MSLLTPYLNKTVIACGTQGLGIVLIVLGLLRVFHVVPGATVVIGIGAGLLVIGNFVRKA